MFEPQSFLTIVKKVKSPFNSSFVYFQIDPESDEEGDVKLDIKTRKEIKMYRCSDENGTFEILEVKSGPLDQQDLLSKDSFIIDNGIFGIWAFSTFFDFSTLRKVCWA